MRLSVSVGSEIELVLALAAAAGAAFEMLGNAKASPTVAVVRMSFSFMTAPLDPSPCWFVVYHSERAGSRERTFSSDIAYSDSPAASRASPLSLNSSTRMTFRSRTV